MARIIYSSFRGQNKIKISSEVQTCWIVIFLGGYITACMPTSCFRRSVWFNFIYTASNLAPCKCTWEAGVHVFGALQPRVRSWWRSGLGDLALAWPLQILEMNQWMKDHCLFVCFSNKIKIKLVVYGLTLIFDIYLLL